MLRTEARSPSFSTSASEVARDAGPGGRLRSKLYPVALPPANRMDIAKYLFQDDFRSASDLAAQLLSLE